MPLIGVCRRVVAEKNVQDAAASKSKRPNSSSAASSGQFVWIEALGHAVTVPGDHEPARGEDHPGDGVTVHTGQHAREGHAKRQGDDAAALGQTCDHFLVHRAISFLGARADALTPNEWTKPSSASSSTESFRW